MRVQIPDKLQSRIEPLVEQYGYGSYADFVRESIRLRADELEQDK